MMEKTGTPQGTGPLILGMRELARRARVANLPTILAPSIRPDAIHQAPAVPSEPQPAPVALATPRATDAMPAVALTPTIALIAETVHRYRRDHGGTVPREVYLHPMRLLSMASVNWEACEVEGGVVQLRTWEGLGIDEVTCCPWC